MRIIAIDEGNTRIKVGIFEGENLINTFAAANFSIIKPTLPAAYVDHIIYSSVRAEKLNLASAFPDTHVFSLSPNTPLPFSSFYASMATLGHDRKAAVAGLMHFYPGENAVAINLGTCITFDLLEEGQHYTGGTISPGVYMRYRAMHEFTGALPQLDPEFLIEPSMGHDTTTCMHHGVMGGIKSELNDRISLLQSKYSALKIVISGGDAPLVFPMLPSHLLLQPHLNLWGLRRILQHLLEIR